MRTTIHLVTARDFLALYPVMQPVHVRTVYSSSPERRALEFAAPGARDHRVRIAPAD
jgi:hypothetical protein